MFDFYLGTADEIRRDELKYLVAVKRMTPRWINSMPDSEFIALSLLLDEQGRKCQAASERFVCVETGAGASSLALAFYAAKYGGVALSWDMNAAKGSAVRQVLSETVSQHFDQAPTAYWNLVAADSLSPYLGLGVLPDLCDRVALSFHDSDHTWKVLGGELELVAPRLGSQAVVALDDANLQWNYTNIGYVNTLRRKLGLGEVATPPDNVGEPFHVRCDDYLRTVFSGVERIDDYYKDHYGDDPYFLYYSAEFDVKSALGTERTDALDHRFDAWSVENYRG